MPLDYSTDLGPLDRLKNDLALRVRRKTFELFMRECAPTPQMRVADFGVSGHRDHPAHFFFELWYPYREQLTALGRAAEGADWLQEQFPELTFLEADLRAIPLEDNHFDVGICNAVVEHAGLFAQQQALVREVCRVCRVVLFTTPNKSFLFELHTFLPIVHWLPDRYFRAFLRLIGQHGFADVDNLNPLDSRTFRALFPVDRRNRLLQLGPRMLRTNLACISTAAHT